MERKQPVLYIAERCVFELCAKGLKLIEVAPGIDVQKHILDQMEFKSVIEGDVRQMDAGIFRDNPLGLSADFFNKPF